MEKDQLDLNAIRARLARKEGRQYWRSLEELADTPAFRQFLHREFPQGASEWTDQVSRRNFLKLMGASLALAGLAGCAPQSPENILPYIQQPEVLVPGKPLFFATAMPFPGGAIGLLGESNMGRPTKLEGNPNHPASLGATDAFAQGAILSLYDPDRSKAVARLGVRISTWESFQRVLTDELDAQRATGGAGLRILTETVMSPTLASQLTAFLADFPAATWHQYEPVNGDNARAGARLAFGREVSVRYDLSRAEVILALDADFLACGPGHVRYARDFADRRRVTTDQTDMNRLYVVESMPSPTGAIADHRLPLRPSQVETFARLLARELGLDVDAPEGALPDQANWIAALARDLQNNRGASLVIPGDYQSPAVHALAHAINDALGNAGATVIYADPVEPNPVDQFASLRDLVEAIRTGQVDLLLIMGGNPVYNAPVELAFGEQLFNVKTRMYLGLYQNETSELCQWHVPETHFLETWSDTRAFDGTVSLIQPLIEPLYDGKSAHELLAAMLGQTGTTGYELLQGYWQGQNLGGADFNRGWQTALHEGVVPDTVAAPVSVTLQANWAGDLPAGRPGDSADLEISFRPDPSVWDGRFANNGWLQELPRPLTKLTWDNAVMISAATAARLGLKMEDVVELRYRDRSVRGPVWIVPGHADDCVTVHLGYGRRLAGQVGNGVGFNAYTIRTAEAPWSDAGLELAATGETYNLVTTQHLHSLEAPEERVDLVVRSGTIEQFRQNPEFVHEMSHLDTDKLAELSLYPEYEYKGNAWGMAIDMSNCLGCNACVIACQAENNIPVVGKEQVDRGREMHWLRIDLYYHGNMDNPDYHHQPMLCQHCEKAPCEVVCPVAATVHDAEGLNNMVYNRCVGTRYCSNNCPYKVRRFNFLQYSDIDTPVIQLMHNPDVTVRTRGIMEKCTFCVQRINAARIEAKKEDRPIRDGEVVTACQAACPTRAIVFGNINDPNSEVARQRQQPHGYGVLAELNTQPRITYLARLNNPNPEIEDGVA